MKTRKFGFGLLALALLALSACAEGNLVTNVAAAQSGMRGADVKRTYLEDVSSHGCAFDDRAAHIVEGTINGRTTTRVVCCGPNREGGCAVEKTYLSASDL